MFQRHQRPGIAGLSITGLLSVAVLAVLGCDARSDAAQAAPPAPEVDVAEVMVETVTVTESFTGRVEAPETVALRPRVSGYIDGVSFTEGELVEAGDILFRIDARPYLALAKAARAELEEARVRLELAEQEAGRARELVADRAISREEHDQRQADLAGARARVSLAEAALETAELDLEYTNVTAPVSGRAGRALVTRGNLANADQSLLTTIVSVDPLYVYFDSNESTAQSSLSLVDPRAETPVLVSLDGTAGQARDGRLDYVHNQLDAGTGTLTFRAVLPNPGGAIKPGQFARVEMPVERYSQAVLVDRKAILADQDRRYVYVVNDDNTVARRDVVTGPDWEGLLVIDQGLAAGDRVVVTGTQKIYFPGMTVEPNYVAMRAGAGDDAVAMSRP